MLTKIKQNETKMMRFTPNPPYFPQIKNIINKLYNVNPYFFWVKI